MSDVDARLANSGSMYDPLERVLFTNAVIARLLKPYSRSQITLVVTREKEQYSAMSTYSPFVMDSSWLFERILGSGKACRCYKTR